MINFQDMYIKNLLRNVFKGLSLDGNELNLSEEEIDIVLSMLADDAPKNKTNKMLIKTKGGTHE